MSGICLPIDAGGPFPAAQHRIAQSPLMAGSSARPLGALSGIRAFAEPVVTILSTTTFSVSPFSAIVDPGTALTVGAYLVAFPATETVTYNVADGSNVRFDDVSIVVPDDPSGAFGNVAKIVVTPGTPGGSGGAQPARGLQLGFLTVPKAGTGSATFTPTRNLAVASGGIKPTFSAAQRPTPDLGRYIDDTTTGRLLRGNGAGFDTVADVAGWQPWTAYVPTWTGSDGSTAPPAAYTALSGKYTKNGTRCVATGLLNNTGTNTPGGTLQFALPLPAVNTNAALPIGNVIFVGGTNVLGVCSLDTGNASKINFQFHGVGGRASAAAGNPAAWTLSRVVTWQVEYEVAP